MSVITLFRKKVNLFMNFKKLNIRFGSAVSAIIVFLFIIIAVFGSCKRRPSWQADISQIQIPPVEIKRYEKVLFGIDPANLRAEIDPYIEEFRLFLGYELDNPMVQQQLLAYITDPFILELYSDVAQAWPELGELENQLTTAFHYYVYHFPENDVPVVYSYISGVDYHLPVKYHENNLIVGLDMFMGIDYPNYDRVGMPVFIRQRFIRENAPKETMLVLAHNKLRQNPVAPETLLDFMIFEGKLLYFLDCMFPLSHDSLKIAFTSQHILWADRYQGHAWAHFIENELLYSTDNHMIRSYIGEAPFTDSFSSNSAPRMGAYIGWQIVRAFMRRNPEVTLNELLTVKSAVEILNQANYRP